MLVRSAWTRGRAMDLAFAIDDLYSTGWWPADGDSCLCNPDGLWFPDRKTVEFAFRHAGRSIELSPSRSGAACRAMWVDARGVTRSVLASDESTAGLLALAEFRRSGLPAVS
ncbi:MAG: hypothetical protein AAGA55_01435 [Planctomycetota bacterium]